VSQPATASHEADQSGPVESRTRILVDRYGVTIRWTTSGIAALFCLLSPRLSVWQIPICLIVIAWSIFRLTQRRRPTTTALLCADLAIACFVGLTTSLTTTATSVFNLAGLGVNVANPASLTFAWQPRRSVAALLCCTVIGCYLIGASLLDEVGPPWTTSAFYLLPIQAAVSRALVEILMPAARAADRAAAGRLRAVVELEVATARRAAEREHWAILHDTAASTLLMVGEGVPAAANDRIRRQATRDLRTLGQLGDEPDTGDTDLSAAVSSACRNQALPVDLRLPERLLVPSAVADATVRAIGELLTNVERHSGVDAATIELAANGNGFQVTIADAGSGFDPQRRGRGLTESVIGRMNRVGGVVDIRSTPGAGTVVELHWRPV
jgi:signal transduction histidine kinase